MSMYPHPIAPIPAETAPLAWTINPKGTLIRRVRARLGSLYQEEDFVRLYPATGQPAFEPWRLALLVVFEYVEGLTDPQAAAAVRNRIDWKYARSLELTEELPSFTPSRGWNISRLRLKGLLESALLTGTCRLKYTQFTRHFEPILEYDLFPGVTKGACYAQSDSFYSSITSPGGSNVSLAVVETA